MAVGPWEGSVRRRRTMTRKPAKTRHSPSATTRQRPHPASSTIADLREQVSALTRELAEAREQQTATSEVLRVISSSRGELEPVFQTMLENATRLCEAKFGVFFLHEGGGLIRNVASHNVPPAFAEAIRQHSVFRPAADGVFAGAMKTEQAVQIADLTATRGYTERQQPTVDAIELGGVRTIVGVPMLKDNEVIGVIAIFRQEVRPFTDKQVDLLQNFAAQAVIAIENTRLLNELRESLQQQTATADVLKTISRSTFDLQTVLDTLVKSAAQLCRAQRAAIRLAKDGLYHHVASYGYSPEFKQGMMQEPLSPGQGSVAGRVVLESKSVQLPDAWAVAGKEQVRRARRTNTRTILGVPLLREGTPIGVLLLHKSIVEPFTNKQIELAETFADQAVIAIENTRLFDEIQDKNRQLQQALEQQTATSEVLKVISSSPGELNLVFNIMLAKATELCEASYGTLWLRDGDGYRAVAIHGDLPTLFVEQWRSGTLYRPDPEVTLARSVRARKPIQEADVRTTPQYLKGDPLPVTAVDIAGIRTLMVVPMLKDNEPIGGIAIYRKEVRPFGEKQIELVTNFAAQAVIAIENARLLNELRQRTDDLSEALEQQTATSEVLRVISNSPGELEAVFQAMLANAVRICGANFGNLYLREAEEFRIAAAHNTPPAMIEARRRMPIRTDTKMPVSRVIRTKQTVHILDMRAEEAYLERAPLAVAAVELGGVRTLVIVPMLKEQEVIGTITIFRQEVRPFTH